jgi:hypothetical protein
VSDVGRQHPLEMATVPDLDPVQALGPNAAHPALRIRVRARIPDPGLHDPDTLKYQREPVDVVHQGKALEPARGDNEA